MRLYPKIRIPYLKEAAYYLQQLSLTMNLGDILDNYQDCITQYGDVSSYKMKKMDEILKYFKEDTNLMLQFNDAPFNEYQSKYPKQFANWKPGKWYLSLDVNEANWSIFKHTIGLMLPSWSETIQDKFGVHKAVAESKSFRQLVLGNMNPSRQQTFQKRFMGDLAAKFELTLWKDNIVMLSPDEILFELEDETFLKMMNCTDLRTIRAESPMPMKLNAYQIDRVDNLGESVLIKRSAKGKELFSVNGSRYFMHYKTLILGKEIEDNDLYFEAEPKRLAKWII